MLQPGTVLRDMYEIDRSLEPGLLESTYVARRRGEGSRSVLVKEIRIPNLGPARQAATQKRLKQLRGLSHPGLVQVLDVFEEDDAIFLILEHVDGPSLQVHVMRESQVQPSQLAAWTSSLCDALSHLHLQEPQICYCALRPDVIAVGPGGDLRLTELGVAQLFDDETRAAWMQQSASCMGFAAPEAYHGEVPAQPAVDVYSLGAVLYFAVTRMLPPGAQLRQSLGIELEPASRFVHDLHPAIDAALTRALHTDPTQRFGAVRELELALLGETCPSCGRERSLGAQICLFCGTELAPRPAPMPRPTVAAAIPAPRPTLSAPTNVLPAPTFASPPAAAPPPPAFDVSPSPPAAAPPTPAFAASPSPPAAAPPPAPAIPDPVPPPVASRPVVEFVLRVLEGAEAGRTVKLPHADVELGRGVPAEAELPRVSFAEPTISRVQAYLVHGTTGYTIRHEPRATNQTAVNDRPVQQQLLRTGDMIRMGHMKMVLEQHTY